MGGRQAGRQAGMGGRQALEAGRQASDTMDITLFVVTTLKDKRCCGWGKENNCKWVTVVVRKQWRNALRHGLVLVN